MAKRSKSKTKAKPGSPVPAADPREIAPPVNGAALLKALAIVIAVAWIYGPICHGNWLWDDNIDITQNKITQSGTGLWDIWFIPGTQLDYYPLKATVQWVQWHMWQGHTLGYHLTNIFLHLASALLVWRLLGKLGLRWAWLGGLLFAIHPVQVESVAWIAELKNTLSTPLFLLAMCFYLDFDTDHSRRDYLLALGFFLLAMLSKTTVVMFPVVILLYVWWKRNRFKEDDLKASLPFFLVSLVLGVITLCVGGWYRDMHHAIYRAPQMSELSRLALTSSSIAFYFWKSVWPMQLMPIYPQWKINPPSPLLFLPWLVMAGLFLWFWKQRVTWGRHALLGFGFFLIMLAPFVSINVAGYMDFTWVMDHFLYVPLIGLIGLAVAGVEILDRQAGTDLRFTSWAVVTVIAALLIGKSHSYAKRFLSHETLWSYALKHNPEAWPAHNNLGNVYYDNGQLPEALTEYEAVIRINPAQISSRCNIGHIKQVSGDLDGALDAYNKTIELAPGNGEAYYSRALVLQARRKWDDCLADLLMAQSLSPDTVYADYTHLLIWRVRLAQNQVPLADQELAAALARGWNSTSGDWVSTVARFLLGQVDEKALFAAVPSTLPEQQLEQQCEAWYFAGIKHLATGDNAAAAADFKMCIGTQQRASAEYMLAQAELAALTPHP